MKKPQRKLPKQLIYSLFIGTRWAKSWLWALVISLFVMAFTRADFSTILFAGPVTNNVGIVIDAIELSVEVNDKEVYENHYRFKDNHGIEYFDFSYANGKWLAANKQVVIEHPVGLPQYSRIQGMRRTLVADWLAWIPLILLACYLVYIGKAWQQVRLLQTGHPGVATLVKKEVVAAGENSPPLHKLDFVFRDHRQKEHWLSVKTYKTDELVDDKEEAIVFDREEPERAVLLGSLPCSPIFDEDDIIIDQAQSKKVFMTPLLVIVGFAWVIL